MSEQVVPYGYLDGHSHAHWKGGSDPLSFDDIMPWSGPAVGDILVATTVNGRIVFRPYSIVVPGGAALRNGLFLDQGNTTPTWKPMFDATNPSTIVIPNTAAPGTSLFAAHRDHAHGEAAHNLLSAAHGDTTAASEADGALIAGISGTWQAFTKPASPSILENDGSNVIWDDMSWTSVSFNAGDFTCLTAGTWTVASGDVSMFKYKLIGKTMWVNVILQTTTVARSGGNPTHLLIKIPASKTAAANYTTTAWLSDNGTVTNGLIQTSGTNIFISRFDSAQWANATDNTYMNFQLVLETT